MIRNSLKVARLRARFSSSFNQEEVGKFGKVKDWWDPSGSQRGLHAYNPLRVDFVRKLTFGYGHASSGFHFLRHKKLLDVGCGPGIFAEVALAHQSIARFGGEVTGLDASAFCVDLATKHKLRDPKIRDSLSYVHGTLGRLR